MFQMQISKMSNIEVLKELKDRGVLKPLVMAGIIPIKVETQAEMFYHVNAQMQRGVKESKAVACTACQFNVSNRTVKRAVVAMG